MVEAESDSADAEELSVLGADSLRKCGLRDPQPALRQVKKKGVLKLAERLETLSSVMGVEIESKSLSELAEDQHREIAVHCVHGV